MNEYKHWFFYDWKICISAAALMEYYEMFGNMLFSGGEWDKNIDATLLSVKEANI